MRRKKNKNRRSKNRKEPPKVSVEEHDDQHILDNEDDFIHSLKKRFPELDSWVIRLVWDETRPEQVNTIVKLSSIALAARQEKAKLQPSQKPPELLARASAPISRLNSPKAKPLQMPACLRSVTSVTTPRGFVRVSPPLRSSKRRPNLRPYKSDELRPLTGLVTVLPPPMRLPATARRGSDSYTSLLSPKLCRTNDNKLPRSAKLCKYFLTGMCKKGANCIYSHEPSTCQYISLRKMNMKPKQLERTLDLVEENEQIWFLNVGRNRVGSKMAAMIAKVVPLPHVRRLSMDSTAIGRAGMLTIIDAACESRSLEYLDLSDTECCRALEKSMTAEERRFAQMKRQEIVTGIINLLNSNTPLKHLYIGHNGFTFPEIRRIVMNGNDYNSCLLTLDVYGNILNTDEIQWVHDQVYNMRYGKTYNALLRHFKEDHEDLVQAICQFCHGQGEANYRCVDWKPKRRGSVSKKKRNVYAEADSGQNSDDWGLYDDLIEANRYVGRNRRGRNGRKNGQWDW